MKPVQQLKQNISEHPVAYIAATAVVGVVAGVLISRKFGVSTKVVNALLDARPEATDVLNNWTQEMNAVGFEVLLLNPSQMKEYVKALDSIRLEK